MRDALFILLLIAAGQGMFLAIFLVSQLNKVRTNLFLGCIFLFFSLQLLDLVLLSSGKALEYPLLVFWSAPLNLAFGPLLYLFIRGHEKGQARQKNSLIHFLPFVLHIAYVCWIYHLHSIAYKKQFITLFIADRLGTDGLAWEPFGLIFSILVYLQFGLYLRWSKQRLSNQEGFAEEKLSLLKKLWWAVLIIGLFGVVQFILLLLGIEQQPTTGYLASFLAVLYIYSGAFILFKKPAIVFPQVTKPKYQYSTLDEQSAQQTLDQVKAYMASVQPFLSHDFNLRYLARGTHISERHISQAINEILSQNFSDFVNYYRIEAFKQRLINGDDQHMSLLGLAMDCGFKSKSTFNTAFKRLTGQTPSEFKQQIFAEK